MQNIDFIRNPKVVKGDILYFLFFSSFFVKGLESLKVPQQQKLLSPTQTTAPENTLSILSFCDFVTSHYDIMSHNCLIY